MSDIIIGGVSVSGSNVNQEFEYHVMRFIVGQRPYLHDDLRAFKLSIALIAEPPLE
ncbi:MAG: hypothetical protein IPJ94_23245 [Chloroflexi bacterium]|nr:hypothetical protein [Chloroflexota bacterium]